MKLRQREKAKSINMLRELAEKLVKGEFEAVSSGFWKEGTYDRFTFQFHVRVTNSGENPQESDSVE